MVPPGSSDPPGGPRIIVKYQVTTFNLHRMPTLLIVREKGVSGGGWPLQRLLGGKQRVWNGRRAASRFVGSKFVLESPSTVWPLPLLQWAVGGWTCFATLGRCIDRRVSVWRHSMEEVYGQPPYGGRGLWQLQLKEDEGGWAIICDLVESLNLGLLAIWWPLSEVLTWLHMEWASQLAPNFLLLSLVLSGPGTGPTSPPILIGPFPSPPWHGWLALHVDWFIAFSVSQEFEYQWSLSIVSGWDVITTIRGPARRSRDPSRDCLCPARG